MCQNKQCLLSIPLSLLAKTKKITECISLTNIYKNYTLFYFVVYCAFPLCAGSGSVGCDWWMVNERFSCHRTGLSGHMGNSLVQRTITHAPLVIHDRLSNYCHFLTLLIFMSYLLPLLYVPAFCEEHKLLWLSVIKSCVEARENFRETPSCSDAAIVVRIARCATE